jgi:hypothetical protein
MFVAIARQVFLLYALRKTAAFISLKRWRRSGEHLISIGFKLALS